MDAKTPEPVPLGDEASAVRSEPGAQGPSPQLVELPSFTDENGELVVGELPAEMSFQVERAFFVHSAPTGSLRGEHAHRSCTQVLVCVSGAVEVVVDDGRTSRSELLDVPTSALVIPPLHWSRQVFARRNTVLLVLADAPYDESEYIRSRTEFDSLTAPIREGHDQE